MPEIKEKEPAPSANDTSSKQNISHNDNNISCAFCQGDFARKLRIVAAQLYSALEFIPNTNEGNALVQQSIGSLKLMICDLEDDIPDVEDL